MVGEAQHKPGGSPTGVQRGMIDHVRASNIALPLMIPAKGQDLPSNTSVVPTRGTCSILWRFTCGHYCMVTLNSALSRTSFNQVLTLTVDTVL